MSKRQDIAITAGLWLFAMAAAASAEPTGRLPDASASTTAPVSGHCVSMTAIDFQSDNSLNASTTSSNFVNVPNALISFTQGGAGNGCVIVTFNADAWAPSGRLLQVRTLLDGAVVAQPGLMQLSGDDDENNNGKWSRAHSATFILPSVAPGAHTIAVQYASGNSGFRVYLYKHSTVIQHP